MSKEQIAGRIEAAVLWSTQMDQATARRLAALAAELRGELRRAQ